MDSLNWGFLYELQRLKKLLLKIALAYHPERNENTQKVFLNSIFRLFKLHQSLSTTGQLGTHAQNCFIVWFLSILSQHGSNNSVFNCQKKPQSAKKCLLAKMVCWNNIELNLISLVHRGINRLRQMGLLCCKISPPSVRVLWIQCSDFLPEFYLTEEKSLG